MIDQFATMRVPAEIFLDPLYNPYVANQGLSHSRPEVPNGWIDYRPFLRVDANTLDLDLVKNSTGFELCGRGGCRIVKLTVSGLQEFGASWGQQF